MKNCRFVCVAAMLVAACGSARAISVNVAAKIGDTFGARTVTGVGQPFTNSQGQVGFVMIMNDGTRSIYYGNGELWNSSAAAPDTLTGSEDTMGISDAAGFNYSPSFNGSDSAYTHIGKLLAAGDLFPPNGQFSSFNSRTRMSANGTAWWVAGWTGTAGGSTVGRALVKADPTNPGSVTSVLKGGDVVSGVAVAAQGIGFAYDINDNATHWVNNVTLSGVPTTSDTAIVVDGVIVAREGDPTGFGANWQNWRFVGINNSGNYTIIGDDSSAADDFVTFNSGIAVRQGQVLAGLTLGATVDMVSINNNNQIAMIWDLAAGGEGLFLGAGDDLLSAQLMLRTGDLLDTDGDTIPDYTLTDFTASATIAPGLDLADSGGVWVNASITPIAGGAAIEAIINIPAPGAASTLALVALAGVRRRR